MTQFSDSFLPAAQAISAHVAINNIANKKLELVHPWCLSPRKDGLAHTRIGIIHLPFHANWPWSEKRWRFMLQAMHEVTDFVWAGDVGLLDLSGAASVHAQSTWYPGYREALAKLAESHAVTALTPPPRLLPDPAMACRSFSKFYDRVRRDVGQFADLL